jgi:hypothetical protein
MPLLEVVVERDSVLLRMNTPYSHDDIRQVPAIYALKQIVL